MGYWRVARIARRCCGFWSGVDVFLFREEYDEHVSHDESEDYDGHSFRWALIRIEENSDDTVTLSSCFTGDNTTYALNTDGGFTVPAEEVDSSEACSDSGYFGARRWITTRWKRMTNPTIVGTYDSVLKKTILHYISRFCTTE